MKGVAAVAVSLLLVACASGNRNVSLIEPEVSMVQIIGPSEMSYPTGPIEVKFGIDIINKSAEPITLRSIEFSTRAGGGAYEILPQSYPYNTVIPGNKEASLERCVKAFARGRGSLIQNAPVTVRAVVQFATPAGAISKVILLNIGQYPGSSPG